MRPRHTARRRTSFVPAATTYALAITALAVAVLAIAPAPAPACDICAIYTGSLMRQDKTGVILGASEQFTYFSGIREDDRSVPNPDNEWVSSSTTQLVVGYQVTPRIGVQANVPLISREYRRVEDGIARRGDTGGLGDMSLLARYSPVSQAVGETLVHFEMFAGIKVPTGNDDKLSEELEPHDDNAALSATPSPGPRPRHGDEDHGSAVHGHDLSLGSGSVDGVFGVTLYADWKRLFAHAASQYVVRGNGGYSYEYANDLSWEVGPGFYLVAEHNWTTAVSFIVSGENKGRDHQKGMLLNDTALNAVYLGPGVSMTWSDSLHGNLSVELPVVQDTTGKQIVADYRIKAGLSWRF